MDLLVTCRCQADQQRGSRSTPPRDLELVQPRESLLDYRGVCDLFRALVREWPLPVAALVLTAE
jgi:hypothetical protein